MSCSKWAYTSRCDGDFCPGDCDVCSKANDNVAEMEELVEEAFVAALERDRAWRKLFKTTVKKIYISDITHGGRT